MPPLNKNIKILIASAAFALWVISFYHGLVSGLNFVLSLFGIIILFALAIFNGVLITRSEDKIVSFLIFLAVGLVAPGLYLVTHLSK